MMIIFTDGHRKIRCQLSDFFIISFLIDVKEKFIKKTLQCIFNFFQHNFILIFDKLCVLVYFILFFIFKSFLHNTIIIA